MTKPIIDRNRKRPRNRQRQSVRKKSGYKRRLYAELLEDRRLLSINWDGGAGTLSWLDAANWSTNSLPTATDDVIIPDLVGTPTITIDHGAISIRSLVANEALSITGGSFSVATASALNAGLELSGGILGGSGPVTIGGVLHWLGGTMSGTGQTIVAAGAALEIAGSSEHQLSRLLQNDGAATWTGGRLLFDNGTFENNGSFTANANSTLESYGIGGTNIYRNVGTFTKLGAGVTRFPTNPNELFSENFETDPTSDWTVNHGPAGSDDVANFYFNYDTIGIPLAPNSTTGNTMGLKLQANQSSEIFSGLSVSPKGQSFTGDYTVRFDWWANFNGPFPVGGNGSTQLSTFGIGTSGTLAQWAGGPQDSVWFGGTGDGNSTFDWRAYSSLPANFGIGGRYPENSGVYAAGTANGSSNAANPYYSTFGNTTAPAAQLALFPQQTGATQVGAAGIAWHQVEISKQGTVARWLVDGLLIATVDLTTVTLGGDNIFLGHSDVNATSSTDPNDSNLLFTLIDNVSVTSSPSGPPVTGVTFSNTGVVDIQSGGLDVNSSLLFDGTSTLNVLPLATLIARSSLQGSAADASLYEPAGRVQLQDAANSPQILEVMSRDMGDQVAGVTDNFAYGTLSLNHGAQVRLVDQSDNSLDQASQALYVDRLIVPAGTTLDLNSLTVYARRADIRGTILGGSINAFTDNQAPTITAADSQVIADEGQIAVNHGTFADADGQSVVLSASIGTVHSNGDGTWSWSVETSDGPDDGQTVTISATDSRGVTTSTTFSVTVNNLAPTLTIAGSTITITEGGTATDSGTFGDAGSDTVALSASIGTITKNANGTWSWSFGTTFGIDQTQAVTITATDSDGATTTRNFQLVVNPPLYFYRDGQTTAENAGTVNVWAVLSKPSSHAVVVPVAFSGTAVLGFDYFLPAGNVIIIPAGAIYGYIPVQVVDDAIGEPTEYILASLPAAADNGLPAYYSRTHAIVIPQNDEPNVSFSGSQINATENGGGFSLFVTLSGPSVLPVAVPFTLSGSATSGADYTLSSGTVTIPPGALFGQINVPIINDTIEESDETIQFRLGTPINGMLGANQSFVANIIDDDSQRLSFATGYQEVWEDVGTVNVVVQLSKASPINLFVPIRIGLNGLKSSDLLTSIDPIFIPAGQLSASRPIQIVNNQRTASSAYTPYGDIIVELMPTGGATVAASARHIIRVFDDDPLVNIEFRDLNTRQFLSHADFDESSPSLGGFAVGLTYATNKPVTVPFATLGIPSLTTNRAATPGLDFLAPGLSPLVIPAGETRGAIAVSIIDDQVDETFEDFGLVLGTPVNALLGNKALRVTIWDNDDTARTVRLNKAGQTITVTEGKTLAKKNYQDITVTATISPAPTFEAVDVPITISAKGAKQVADYWAMNTTLHFTGSTASVTVRVYDDKTVEADELIYVSLGRAADPNIRVDKGKVTIKIIDDDLKSTSNKKDTSSVGSLQIDPSSSSSTAKLPKLGKESSGSGKLAPVGSLVIDGYIEGAIAFFDANRNGAPDFLDLNADGIQDDNEPDEPAVLTDIDGSIDFEFDDAFDLNQNGELDNDEGQWVAIGGIDRSIDTPLGLRLRAPVDIYAISPLSTLITELMNQQGVSTAAAQHRVLEAFDLPAAELSILNIPIEASSGNLIAAELFAGAAQIQNTTAAAASLLSGLPGALPYSVLGDLAFADMAAKIANPLSALDLSNPIVVSSVIEGMLFRSGLSLGENEISGAAATIAAANQLIQTIPDTADMSFVKDVARIQKVVQGELAAALVSVGSGITDISTIVQDFSGVELDARVAAAPIGLVIPPSLVVSDVIKNEGDNGQQIYEFTVSLVGESSLGVTVDYTTADHTAESADGDYTPVGGSLSWEPGDNSSRTIQIVVSGDATFESDESFLLILDNAVNAAIREQIGVGFIVNDDALIYQAPSDTASNSLRLSLDGEEMQLYVNDDRVVGGTFFNPVPITILGAPDVENSLDIQIASPSNILAGGLLFQGGNTANDRLDIHDGTASSALHTFSGANSGSFTVDGSLISYAGVEVATDALAPQIAGAPTIGTAGQWVSLESTVLDFFEDTDFNYAWEVERDGLVVATGSDASLQFMPAASGNYLVRLTVSAEGRGAGTEMIEFTVIGPPTADAGGPYIISEGTSATLDGGGSTDPDSTNPPQNNNDIVLYEWDLDYDGVTFDADVWSAYPSVVTEVFPNNSATRAIALRVTDSHGEADLDTSTLTVTNASPTITVDRALATVSEGASAGNTGTFRDVTADAISLSASVGAIVDNGNGTWSWSFSTADGPDESQTVTITATDSDGAATTTTFDLVVNNVAPTLANATFSLVENRTNGSVVGTISAFDPGADTISYNIVGGNGASAFAINASTGAIAVANSALLDFETRSTFTLQIQASDEDGEYSLADITINLLNQASISGVVFEDINENGLYDANEPGIDGVRVELLNQSGAPVLDAHGVAIAAITHSGGYYLFDDLDPGVYQVRELQPTGVTDGAELLGSLGGTVVANDRMQLTLNRTDAFDYAFAEIGQTLTAGDSAGIGFWQNKHGQTLITLGGTALANWLTTNLPNVFGDRLAGATGQQVAEFFRDQLFKQQSSKTAGPAKVDAQFMAVALATYFTSRYLAGNVATVYGFHVTDTGISTKLVNVGTSGAAFSSANGTTLTIMELLKATDALTDLPDNQAGFAYIYDRNGDGLIDSAEAQLRTMANKIFAAINDQGQF